MTSSSYLELNVNTLVEGTMSSFLSLVFLGIKLPYVHRCLQSVPSSSFPLLCPYSAKLADSEIMRQIFFRVATLLSILLLSKWSYALPVIPRARGFGINTPAGRYGAVYKVTNLDQSGPGSLREALDAEQPRVVIFEISGTIWLDDDITVSSPFVTVAGQTAPSPGITIAGAGITVRTHDVLIQHIRVRVGDLPTGKEPSNRDGIQILGSEDSSAHTFNIVIDHCSISWAIDENISTWYKNVRDITFRYCICSEALHRSLHPKGPHSKGLLIGDHARNIAVMFNLFVHNDDRNPLAKGNVTSFIANNVVYDANGAYIHTTDLEGSGPTSLSIVGNILQPGPSTEEGRTEIRVQSYTKEGSQIFLRDNIAPGVTDDPWSIANVDVDFDVKTSQPSIWPQTFRPWSADKTLNRVLRRAGARPLDRDLVDNRVVKDVRNGSGQIIDSQEEVGGWPDLAINRISHSLPEDPNDDDDGDGYTNLEEWLHEMAANVQRR